MDSISQKPLDACGSISRTDHVAVHFGSINPIDSVMALRLGCDDFRSHLYVAFCIGTIPA